jgi:HSP20 family molecular chaperone IbpA
MPFWLQTINGTCLEIDKRGRRRKIMRRNSNYLDLITSIDVLNTLNGGLSEPQMNMNHHEDFREIRVKVPGIRQEDIHVEMHNNSLSIYYFLNLVSGEKLIQLPRFVYSRNVPYFININKIRAKIEDEELIVTLPFNRLANGYHKEIKIKP